MMLNPIGVFQCREKYPYDAARQGVVAGINTGVVLLNAGCNFEQAVQDLDGFSHIWLLYQFHENDHWKPQVQPPRGNRKVGLFATRAPYRPNPIGISCVRLVSAQGLRIEVTGHDLLDGTPILDIKPYLPYADSFPEAVCGWVDEVESQAWQVTFGVAARRQLDWLRDHGVDCLEPFLVQQLTYAPLNTEKKRVRCLAGTDWELAYRTWRARFTAQEDRAALEVTSILSGYSAHDLADEVDRYGDKSVHRAFVRLEVALGKKDQV